MRKTTKNNKPKICAVVVTYNRKDMLLECLDALCGQTYPLEAIYIIDNASTDGTPEILKEKKYIQQLPPSGLTEPWEKEFKIKNHKYKNIFKIFYVRMHKNTGGAGGFYEGVKRGYEKGYDWLWLMDDDAEPREDALEKMFCCFDDGDVFAVSNLKVGIDGRPQYEHRGWKNVINIKNKLIKPIKDKDLINGNICIDHSSFVGFLVSKRAISKVGFPRKDFFIHYDDVEYSFRIRKYGKMILAVKSIILHKDGFKKQIKPKRWFFINLNRMPYSSYWLLYYGIRNFYYIKKSEAGIALTILTGLIYISRLLAGILFFDDNKIKRIKFVLNAFLDGIKGNFDNEKPKKILYE